MALARQILRALGVVALTLVTGAILTLPGAHAADENGPADYLSGSPSNPPDS